MTTLLVISDPAADHLRLLERLPESVNILVGNDPEFIRTQAPNADVILNDIGGGSLATAFSLAHRVRWVHSLSAGVDKILFPELIESPVPLTNSRGVFKDALAEFAIAAILFFAKDLRRLVQNQEAGRWEQFDVVMLRGQLLGIVGYGEIGRETGRLAGALGMQVMPVRRQSGLSKDKLREALGKCDYVVVSAPLTPDTRDMFGEAEFNAMKRTAVIVNIGRGPVITESALIAALASGRIRGAALDVYNVEPLPTDHPFYGMRNVLFSPHSADHAVGWANWAMEAFLENFERFRNGQPLNNVVDKRAGY
jgi:phosphoglycerate dehydrogenase-like enzyme